MEQQVHHVVQNQANALSKLGELTSLSFGQKLIYYYKNPVILNQQYSKDIIPGIYEGGFQLWQCQIDFLKKIFQLQELKKLFIGKSVIQIGCGHGLLAIASQKLGASTITFQDYNQNVIKQLTIPTMQVNAVKCKTNYLWGDWDLMQDPVGYDIILGSEVTYKQENYQKIINFIFKNMKSEGKCILANKSYYFGVGGNLSSFKQKLEQNNLEWRSIHKIVPKSGGNKKEILQITFKK